MNGSTQRYQSRRLDQAGLKMRIKDLAATRVRYGYRRIHVLLRRQGWEISHKRTHRLYRELGLQLRNKTSKRKVKAKLRNDWTPATAPNDCPSMDFRSDQLFDGRKIRVLWRRVYSEHRPHSSLGNQTRIERAFLSGQACLP
ncbi:IS3 family transposase [uncultured Sphingomonas sp.]|uniref:IS3 family transposase n=1 Tax=uncultured Sphingomonas sp. TaxID=158754 RepID=UPI0025DC0A0B|nr:IS3 family transposase [uncultured Sphingomonas sp.]